MDDGTTEDVFTSSRENIISDTPKFTEFLNEIDRIFKKILDEWDDYRRKHGDDGDIDNKKISLKARKAQELFNTTLKEIEGDSKVFSQKGKVEEWARALSEEAQFEIPSYTECFISENLLREYIKEVGISLTEEAESNAEKWKKRELDNKKIANISYDIRASTDNVNYLDMDSLANLVDKPKDKIKEPSIGRSATMYKPIRDAVAHTSIITLSAKQQLTAEFGNIKARLLELLRQVKSSDS